MRAAEEGAPWAEVFRSYEALENSLFAAIDRGAHVSARALPRKELERILVEDRGLDVETWRRISSLLEHTEAVRFAGQANERGARVELAKWIDEAEKLAELLTRPRG
jgi:hypothetical protein